MYTEEELCYISLSHLENISVHKKMDVISLFESAKQCFNLLMSKKEQVVAILGQRAYDDLLAYQNPDYLVRFAHNCESHAITAVTYTNPLYPHALKRLPSPPLVLYCKGNTNLLAKPCISIVGTRDCTRYGTEVAKRFAEELARNDIVVVSGLADGIDASAHMGACLVADKANTIAVLANGVNVCYPQSNASLQRRIVEKGGLVMSEYLPNTRANRNHFPLRNRIIAALSGAVIIVEADMKSGANITKEYARKIDIPTYAVPGQITSHASRGTNASILDGSCKVITSIAEILPSFAHNAVNSEKHADLEKNALQVSIEEREILKILGNEERSFDEIADLSKINAKTLTTLLTNMELGGLILKLGGNFYVAKVKI